MRTVRFATAVLLLFPALLAAQNKKKHTVPAAFESARYVYVEAVEGDAFSPGLLSEDRSAIADVEDALRDWNRYVLTTRRSEADLLFVVRKGRVASERIGATGSIGSRSPNQPLPGQQGPGGLSGQGGPGDSGRPGLETGAEAGPPDDLLQVFLLSPDGRRGARVWERDLDGGLDAPAVPLISQLRRAVDHDYPPNSAPPPAKP